MYNVSQDYLDYINNPNNIGRTMQNKVVIDGVEYLSDVLRSNPKITHAATFFIGGFYSKTCEFEIWNLDGSLSLNNKEVTVYKGLVIDGSIEWVKMGIFKATDPNITTDETAKSIKFLGNDRALLFDVPYESELDWTTAHTGLEIVQEACTKVGVTLETTAFAFASYSFTSKPNFLEQTTYREIIQRLAEIGGEIAYISRNGGLVITGQQNISGVSAITKQKREKLTKELQFGPVNSVALGKADIEDDIVYNNEAMQNTGTGKNKVDFAKYEATPYHQATFETLDYYENITTEDERKLLTESGEELTTGDSSNALKMTITQPYTSTNNFVVQYKIQLKPNTTYTLSWDCIKSNASMSTRWYMYSDRLWGSNGLGSGAENGGTKTFTTDSTGTVVAGLYLMSSVNVGDTVIIEDLQIEEGSTATDYVPCTPAGVISWRIEDNPYVDLIREEIIEDVASQIIGMSIIPFAMNGFIDDYIYDLNDVINIVDDNGNTFGGVMLEYVTKNRIKSDVKASVQTEKAINHDIAGSVKQGIAKVSLQVNHNTQEIIALAQRTEEIEGEIVESATQVTQNAETIIMEALKDYVTTGDFETFQTTISTQFQQTNESFEFNFNNIVNQINSLDGSTQEQFQNISKYIRFVDGKIILGEVGNELELQISNDRISFIQNNTEVAYFSNNKLNVTDGEFINSLTIGRFAWKPRANGNLSLVFVGGGN
jgi:hypothetical protein